MHDLSKCEVHGKERYYPCVFCWKLLVNEYAACKQERIEALEKAAHRDRQLSEAWRQLRSFETKVKELEGVVKSLKQSGGNVP